MSGELQVLCHWEVEEEGGGKSGGKLCHQMWTGGLPCTLCDLRSLVSVCARNLMWLGSGFRERLVFLVDEIAHQQVRNL